MRRVFAIDVERERLLEWSRELGTWSLLDTTGSITDPVLAVALPIQALVSAVMLDDVVAAALLAKGNPVLAAAIERRGAEARVEALARAILVVLEQRGLGPTDDERRRNAGLRAP